MTRPDHRQDPYHTSYFNHSVSSYIIQYLCISDSQPIMLYNTIFVCISDKSWLAQPTARIPTTLQSFQSQHIMLYNTISVNFRQSQHIVILLYDICVFQTNRDSPSPPPGSLPHYSHFNHSVSCSSIHSEGEFIPEEDVREDVSK